MTRKHITPYTVSGFALSLLGAALLGIGVANWQRRRTKLTHAWCR